MIPILDLKRQYKQIGAEVESAVLNVLREGPYILGPQVKDFEKNFAQYCDTQHAISLNSGTDALNLALRALDIGEGDEVITTAFTFCCSKKSKIFFPIIYNSSSDFSP